MLYLNPTLTPHPDYIADESDLSIALRVMDAFMRHNHDEAVAPEEDTDYRLDVDAPERYAHRHTHEGVAR